jgi:quinol monooxygenase YgiN
MYGLIGRIIAVEGKREELAQILLHGISGTPGCLSYVVAFDGEQEDSLSITEVWESTEKHRASLTLAPVQTAITKGKPMIAGFGERYETRPIGGQGI